MTSFPYAKILMTADAVGGIWRYSLDLARELSFHQMETHLAVLGPPPDAEQTAEAAAVPGLTLYTSNYRLEWMDDPWEDVENASVWLKTLYHSIGPDLVHLNHYCLAPPDGNAPVVMVTHSCIYSWWQAVYGGLPPATYESYFQRVKKGLAGAHALVAPSASFAAEIRRIYVPVQEIEVIPNGIREKPLSEISRENRIVTIGRIWDKAKNVSLLEEAATQIPWPLYAVGDRKLDSDGYRSIERRLHFKGRLPPAEIHNLLTSTAVYVHPALYEPFGLAVLEAAQAGCALVLSDIAPLRENWEGAALFFGSSGHKVQLVEVLHQLIQSPSLLAEFQTKARERAKKFSMAQTAASYFSLYHRLLTKQNPNRGQATPPCISSRII